MDIKNFKTFLVLGVGRGTGIARKGGAFAPCQDFFGGFVHNALRALQIDHSSPKSDNFPPKVSPNSPE